MAGSALAVGGIAVTAVLGVGAAIVGGAGATSQRVAAAADAAALAAADAVSGAVAVDSDPCAVAARVAEVHGAALQDCRIDGLEVVVHVAARTRDSRLRRGPGRGRPRGVRGSGDRRPPAGAVARCPSCGRWPSGSGVRWVPGCRGIPCRRTRTSCGDGPPC